MIASSNKNKCFLWIISFNPYNNPIKDTSTDKTSVDKWIKKIDQSIPRTEDTNA